MLQKVVNQNLNNNIYASGIQNSPLAILIQECAFDGYKTEEYICRDLEECLEED